MSEELRQAALETSDPWIAGKLTEAADELATLRAQNAVYAKALVTIVDRCTQHDLDDAADDKRDKRLALMTARNALAQVAG